MGTEVTAALEALARALGLEQTGHRFYLGAAERTGDPRGAETFRSLADDEVLHANYIQRQIDALEQGEGWELPERFGGGEAALDTPLFPEGRLDLEKAVRPDASDMDALLFALKIENDSFDLYAGQAKAAADPQAREVFERLAAAERTHFDLLMSNYDHLSTVGSWA
jgi:rubrerythrin